MKPRTPLFILALALLPRLASAADALVVQNAQWFTSAKKMDVTALVQKQLKNNHLEFDATVALLGEPQFGAPKSLTIRYTLNGKAASKTFPENDRVILGDPLPLEKPVAVTSAISVMDRLTLDDTVSAQYSADSIHFTTQSGKLFTTAQFKTPLVITATVKTDSNNIRLYFGDKGVLIFNWELNGNELRFHDPVTGQQFGAANKGSIPKDTFVEIRWTLNADQSRIEVDGVQRAAFPGDFRNAVGNVGIGTCYGATLTVKALKVAPAATTVARRSPAAPLTIEVSVPAQPRAAKAPPETPFDPSRIERPEYRDAPKSLDKSLASITALVVRTSPDGEATGKTADIIATVPPASRKSDKAGVGFFRADGDDMMKAAFEEAVRAVTLRYPLWEPAHIDVSFGEKFVGHGGPSAGTAFALLMLSCLENFDIDPKCAVTGDISVDWKVRAVGGVAAKLRGAFLDKCTLAAIPDENALAFTDAGIYYGHHAWWDLQVFSIATLQEAQAVVRKDRDPKLAEAIRLFAELQPQLDRAERATLQKPETTATLKHILELAPNHLSARACLALAGGTAPKTLSVAATTYYLGVAWYPFREWLNSDDVSNFKSVTAQTRKRLDALRPIADRSLLPLLTDEAAFLETFSSFLEGRVTADVARARYDALSARAAITFSDRELMEKLIREGY